MSPQIFGKFNIKKEDSIITIDGKKFIMLVFVFAIILILLNIYLGCRL